VLSSPGDATDLPPTGVDGIEQLGLLVGVIDPSGVPVLDGSWLGIGVISVPTSLTDTDWTVGIAAHNTTSSNQFCKQITLSFNNQYHILSLCDNYVHFLESYL
jgi:hypothetical protein